MSFAHDQFPNTICSSSSSASIQSPQPAAGGFLNSVLLHSLHLVFKMKLLLVGFPLSVTQAPAVLLLGPACLAVLHGLTSMLLHLSRDLRNFLCYQTKDENIVSGRQHLFQSVPAIYGEAMDFFQ